ncbi:hypothetical protein QS257_21430 [Terrilactibacillus sp. S3-3]|nr:hypothetical protein QS257_21430 [Terrilactibacillus sp. S3-3]
MLNVGLIGYGAVGKDVAKYIKEEKAGDVQLKAVLVRKKEKYNQLLKDLDCAVYDNKG